jgi:hypothetical protein
MDACRQMLADDHLERIPSMPLWPGSLHDLNTYKCPQTAKPAPVISSLSHSQAVPKSRQDMYS